jgi:double-stranded uracil-DNA glycosylase
MMNRTLPTRWKPTKAQILAARNKLVPDLIVKDLIVLFAGINPGLYTAVIGRHFGRPGNRFWPALHAGGFTPRLFSPFENSLLLELEFGITNIVERATARADELTDDELRAGGQRLDAKVKRWRPAVVAFVGIGPYRIVSGIRDARVGLQDAPSAAATPGSSPTPAALTPTTSPPPSHNSSATSASGPLHSMGVDEIPVGHLGIRRARYRGSPVEREVILEVQC